MMGLSQLSKSSSFEGSPVTFSARKRILYDPLGMIEPLANVGVLMSNRLKSVPS